MYKKVKIKPIALLVSLVLLSTVTIGAMVAYLIVETEQVINNFVPNKVTCEVVEEFDNGVKSNVKIQNTGTVPAYIRAAVVVNWVNKDNYQEILSVKPVLNQDYSMTILEDKWVKGDDNYYYYTSDVQPYDDIDEKNHGTDNDLTEVLIKECKPLKAAPKDDYVLSVQIISSAIQSMPDDVVNVWDNTKVDVTGNGGTLTIASISNS